jgi:Spy/CpxP family protein refolding chaperone
VIKKILKTAVFIEEDQIMKRLMHIIIFLALATFILPLTSYSQDGGKRFRGHFKNTTPEERADFQTNKMKTLLNLSDEQTAKVREINLKYAKENQEVFNSDVTKEEKKNKLRAIYEQKQNELKTVLTEEQYEKLQSEKKEMMDRIRERRMQQ